MQTTAQPMGDLQLLAYVQHMAETAQTDAARCLFREYVALERRLLAAKVGHRSRETASSRRKPAAEG